MRGGGEANALGQSHEGACQVARGDVIGKNQVRHVNFLQPR